MPKTITPETEEETKSLSVFTIRTGAMKAASGNDGEPIIRVTASSTSIDLEGDRFTDKALKEMQAGFKGLTIFLNHKYDVPESVFGTVTSAELVEREDFTDLDLEIRVSQEGARAMETYRLIQNGIKLGVSVGVMVDDVSKTDEKYRGRPVIEIDSTIPLEASVVGIPANRRSWVQDALVGLVERGYDEVDTKFVEERPWLLKALKSKRLWMEDDDMPKKKVKAKASAAAPEEEKEKANPEEDEDTKKPADGGGEEDEESTDGEESTDESESEDEEEEEAAAEGEEEKAADDDTEEKACCDNPGADDCCQNDMGEPKGKGAQPEVVAETDEGDVLQLDAFTDEMAQHGFVSNFWDADWALYSALCGLLKSEDFDPDDAIEKAGAAVKSFGTFVSAAFEAAARSKANSDGATEGEDTNLYGKGGTADHLRLALVDVLKSEPDSTIAPAAVMLAEMVRAGARNAKKDAERIQGVHNLSVDLGADCSYDSDESEQDEGEEASDSKALEQVKGTLGEMTKGLEDLVARRDQELAAKEEQVRVQKEVIDQLLSLPFPRKAVIGGDTVDVDELRSKLAGFDDAIVRRLAR